MTVKDFLEYVAYNEIEPFGEDREDMRAAMTPWLVSGYFAKKGKAPKFNDFLLSNILSKRTEPTKSQTKSQMASALKALYFSSREP